MILRKSELTMVRRGRPWFPLAKYPNLKPGRVVRLRSSRRDPGVPVTVRAVVPDGERWRVLVRLGDCTEHLRLLSWSGSAGSGEDGDRGYTEEWHRSMQDEPEAVSDSWLKRWAA